MIELKIWPEPFKAVISKKKQYEVRKADREFKVGDDVMLREYLPKKDKYTGEFFLGKITYITKAGTWGLPKNLCVFGFKEWSNGY
jgi:hypothetical protein